MNGFTVSPYHSGYQATLELESTCRSSSHHSQSSLTWASRKAEMDKFYTFFDFYRISNKINTTKILFNSHKPVSRSARHVLRGPNLYPDISCSTCCEHTVPLDVYLADK
ncbi:hypothetical protein CBL_12415 [Carabus blaptoides fortunei]